MRSPAAETLGWIEKRALSSLVVVKVSVCADSLAGPGLIPVANPLTVCGPASRAALWSAPRAKAGASFTGFTVMVTVAGSDV